jgi:hypothetical protein
MKTPQSKGYFCADDPILRGHQVCGERCQSVSAHLKKVSSNLMCGKSGLLSSMMQRNKKDETGEKLEEGVGERRTRRVGYMQLVTSPHKAYSPPRSPV